MMRSIPWRQWPIGPRARPGRVSDQAVVGGPARELVPARQLELPQDGRHVSLDRLDRDRELVGDLLVSVATSDVAEHLPLPRRELSRWRRRLAAATISSMASEQPEPHLTGSITARRR